MDVIISGKDIVIDWDWVRHELIRKERINSFDKKASTAAICACADECLSRAKDLAVCRVVSAKRRVVSLARSTVTLDKGIRLSGKKLAVYLKGAGHIRIFLVSIGDRIEHEATSLMHKGEHLHGYMLDRIGSFAVESAAVRAEQVLRERYAAKGMSVSMRLSPGYCDWPIEEQAILAQIIDFSRAGVSLTRTHMMVPKKSISAMVGIAPAGHFTQHGSPCSICTAKTCSYRR